MFHERCSSLSYAHAHPNLQSPTTAGAPFRELFALGLRQCRSVFRLNGGFLDFLPFR